MLGRELRKENIPLTSIAVGDKMISNGERAHRWADPILPIMYFAGLCQPLGQTSPQRMQHNGVMWYTEVDGVAAQGREVPGRNRQAPVAADKQRAVA